VNFLIDNQIMANYYNSSNLSNQLHWNIERSHYYLSTDHATLSVQGPQDPNNYECYCTLSSSSGFCF